ncbi:MAG: hypothetical protein JXR37_10895 [Kiritimatiellae bacterium]|nr:hypothetical protein [Kiritimatiellia bacterium]
MSPPIALTFHTRRQKLAHDEQGHNVWQVIEEAKDVVAQETAVIICDMWDDHTSTGAAQRVAAMAPKMNEVIMWPSWVFTRVCAFWAARSPSSRWSDGVWTLSWSAI